MYPIELYNCKKIAIYRVAPTRNSFDVDDVRSNEKKHFARRFRRLSDFNLRFSGLPWNGLVSRRRTRQQRSAQRRNALTRAVSQFSEKESLREGKSLGEHHGHRRSLRGKNNIAQCVGFNSLDYTRCRFAPPLPLPLPPVIRRPDMRRVKAHLADAGPGRAGDVWTAVALPRVLVLICFEIRSWRNFTLDREQRTRRIVETWDTSGTRRKGKGALRVNTPMPHDSRISSPPLPLPHKRKLSVRGKTR